MAKYVLHAFNVVTNIVEADAAWILRYHMGADLLPDGVFVSPGYIRNGPGDYSAPAPTAVVPSEVTMRQARLVLMSAGLTASINAAINAMPSPQKEAAQIEWEYSNTLQRNNPLVLALAPALGLTSQQLDNLFIAAAKL